MFAILLKMYHNVLVNLNGFFRLAGSPTIDLITFCGLLHLAAMKIAVKYNQLHFVASYISQLYSLQRSESEVLPHYTKVLSFLWEKYSLGPRRLRGICQNARGLKR